MAAIMSSSLLSASRKQCIPTTQFSPPLPSYCHPTIRLHNLPTPIQIRHFQLLSCLPPTFTPHKPPFNPSTKLFVSGLLFTIFFFCSSADKVMVILYVLFDYPFSGLSFRTTEDSLRTAFKSFGNLVQGMRKQRIINDVSCMLCQVSYILHFRCPFEPSL